MTTVILFCFGSEGGLLLSVVILIWGSLTQSEKSLRLSFCYTAHLHTSEREQMGCITKKAGCDATCFLIV